MILISITYIYFVWKHSIYVGKDHKCKFSAKADLPHHIYCYAKVIGHSFLYWRSQWVHIPLAVKRINQARSAIDYWPLPLIITCMWIVLDQKSQGDVNRLPL